MTDTTGRYSDTVVTLAGTVGQWCPNGRYSADSGVTVGGTVLTVVLQWVYSGGTVVTVRIWYPEVCHVVPPGSVP